MDTIKDYLESLFLGIPESEKKQQLKEDLLANMEDRYTELLEEGKGEHEAIGITITEFGSLDELLDELGVSKKAEPEEEDFDWGESISEEEAFAYLRNYRKSAVGIATGVLLCILAVAAMIFFADWGRGMIGMFMMFVFAAAGVGFLISSGMALSAAGKKLNDRLVPDSVAKIISQIKDDFQRSFVLCIVLGVCLCILAVGMIFVSNYVGGYGLLVFSSGHGVPVMFGIAAFGVFLLIYGGMVQSSFDKFIKGRVFVSDEDELGPRARQEIYGSANAPMQHIDSFYWPVVVCIFLVWGFVFHGWGISWIIFPIAGVFYGGIKNIFSARGK